MFRRASFLFLLFVLFFFSAQGCIFNFSSPNYTVNVKDKLGLGLWFSFYETSNTSAEYTVGLKQIWEADNSDLSSPIAGSQIQLNETVWTCLQHVDSSDTTLLYLTAAPNSRYSQLVLNTSFFSGPADFNNSVVAGVIAVNLTNYVWINDNETTQLVFTWYVDYSFNTKEDAEMTPKTKGGKTVDFAGAYFSINNSATNVNGSQSLTVDASLSLASKFTDVTTDKDVYVAYDHFSGSLTHDPQFGFGSGPGSNLLWIIIVVVVIIAILVILLIAVIGFVLVRRRRRSYDSF